MDVLNLLLTKFKRSLQTTFRIRFELRFIRKFLNSSKILRKFSRMSPKILKNHPKMKFSITFRVSHRSIRSEPCSMKIGVRSVKSKDTRDKNG